MQSATTQRAASPYYYQYYYCTTFVNSVCVYLVYTRINMDTHDTCILSYTKVRTTSTFYASSHAVTPGRLGESRILKQIHCGSFFSFYETHGTLINACALLHMNDPRD